MADFNELPAHVWPRNAQRQEDGEVTIAGVPLSEIAEEFGTPVMVFDEDDFRSRCRDMADAFGGADRVHYASKAFLSKRIARWVNEEGLALDVASLGELQIALAAEFPAERITVHGNNKSARFLQACVDAKVGHVVIDSADELQLLDLVAAKAQHVQPVLIRVTPGVDAHTHEFIATSHEDQKFGISLATGDAFEAAKACLRAENLTLVGLHCHVGSQVFDAEGFKLAAERVMGLYSQIHNELDYTLQEIDLGGGYGIPYTAYEGSIAGLVVGSSSHRGRARYYSTDRVGRARPRVGWRRSGNRLRSRRYQRRHHWRCRNPAAPLRGCRWRNER